MKYLIPYPEGFCEDRKYPLILFPELGHNCWETVYSDERNYDWLLAFTNVRDKTLVEELSGNYYG